MVLTTFRLGAGLLLGLVSMVSVAQAEDKPATVKLCFENEDVFPWILKNGKGLNLIMVDMISRKAGIKIEPVGLPWKRCLNELQSGGMDGAFAASYKDDRAVFSVYPMKDGKHDPSRRMMMDSYSLFRAKGGGIGWDGSKLNGLSGPIGAQPGYSIIDQLKAAGATVDDGGKTADDNLRKVLAGRVAAAALQTLEGDNSLHTAEFNGKLEKVSPPLTEKPYYMIFAKPFQAKYPKAVEDLWAAVAAVRESPDYKGAEKEFFKR
ncbi:substrate-binding periplasmic protein [Parachitinimonas caeni]|uniref:Transporter substrate-binding domain-containing protein n=1 Tax=Parachitinimonas caeni TaxID=3031301 RepID=A0ABT7DU73_9NEIS|nr:transporter substrate-binding domain-containing protein [Parachitinimonas caeni]MDK2123621.1 transporter substrate-binding domain-containing protein [Parachitinimonas caeni]